MSRQCLGRPVRADRLRYGQPELAQDLDPRPASTDGTIIGESAHPETWLACTQSDVRSAVGAHISRQISTSVTGANRVVAPCSKLGFADWWATTAGPRWVKLPAAATDHRRFWEAMDRLGEADLRTIETELGRRIVAGYGLDLSGLVLDMTNFATYIDSGNDKAPIAQRGKAKTEVGGLH